MKKPVVFSVFGSSSIRRDPPGTQEPSKNTQRAPKARKKKDQKKTEKMRAW